MIDALNVIYPDLGWFVTGAILGTIVGILAGIPLRWHLERRHDDQSG